MTPSLNSVSNGWSIAEKPAPGDHAGRDSLLDVFPDVILKSQFFELVSSRQLTGEQRLMLAVLVDAINIVRGGCRSDVEHADCPFADAKDWIFESDGYCPLAFDDVCDALGIDAPTLRRRIRSMIMGTSDARAVPRRLRLKAGGRARRLTVTRQKPSQPSRRAHAVAEHS